MCCVYFTDNAERVKNGDRKLLKSGKSKGKAHTRTGHEGPEEE
jgi:hypothetical protein